MKIDVRWKQRFANYLAAQTQLNEAVNLASKRPLNDLERQGIIQAFEFTHEIAWNVIRDYFQEQGNMDISGSKDAAREAFNKGLIKEGQVWMEMIKSRNLTSHTYNKNVADQIVQKILTSYHLAFQELTTNLMKKIGQD